MHKNSTHDEDRLRWKRELGIPRERRYVRVAGVATETEIVPFTNTLDTLLRGVSERVFYVKDGDGFARPPRPEPRVFAERLENSRRRLAALLPSTAPVSHDQFVESYVGRKRESYRRALADMRAGRTTPADDSRINVFVKYEKTDRTTKKDPVPRVISPRDPKYNIRVGRYLKPLEHKLFKSIDTLFGHPTIMKGYNVTRTAQILHEKWDSFRNPVAIGLDASRFDQHVSYDALKWEHAIYLECYKVKKHKQRLGSLLEHQLVNHCRGETADGVVEYTVTGTRMSGDMNTSMGNCLLMCMMIHSYLSAKGIKGALANNGDDCVVFMEREQLDGFMENLTSWFLDMGFNMAVETPVYSFEEIEFCQTKPVFDGSIWIMCRNPHTAITKDSVMLKNWDTESLYLGWLDAVGTGGLALAGGLPIFQEVYSLFVRSGKKRPIPQDLLPWSFRTWKEGVNREYAAVSPHCRASFYWAFGITPDEQECLEGYYRELTLTSDPGPYVYRSCFE